MTTFVVVLLFLLGSCTGEVRKEDVDDEDFEEFEFDFGDEEEEEAEIESKWDARKINLHDLQFFSDDYDEDSESEEDDEEVSYQAFLW